MEGGQISKKLFAGKLTPMEGVGIVSQFPKELLLKNK